MKEKIRTKGIAKRLLNVVLALAMVLSLIPMNNITVYANDASWESITISNTDYLYDTNSIDNNGCSLKCNICNETIATYADGDWTGFSELDGCLSAGHIKVKSAHKHTWSYSVENGSTLVATCTCNDQTEGYGSCAYKEIAAGADGRKVSLTLTATSPNYSGSTPVIQLGTDVEKAAWEAAGLTALDAANLKYYKSTGENSITRANDNEVDANAIGAGNYVAEYTIGDDTAKVAVKVTASTTPLTFTAEEANSTITFNWQSGTDVMYSTNGTEWNDYTAGTAITLANVDDTVSFKGTNVTTSTQKHFVMTGKIAASGDVTSLTNGTGGDATLPDSSCYYMFYGCTALTAAPELPATKLAGACYSNMFNGCTALTAAPELPATKMANSCYSHMFNGCTELTEAPELPATELVPNCYNSMFYGCTKLTTAPTLPAEALAKGCYDKMFYDCKKLATAPELLATELAPSCYKQMFRGCTGLTAAPALPATNLEQFCYQEMFYGCKALTAAPELPATTLVRSCYQGMFNDCTSLTSAPELKATTLDQFCYQKMFQNCTGLKVVETSSASEATWIFPAASASNWNSNMISGLTATGTLTAVAVGKMYKVTAALTKLTVTMGETSQQYAYGAKVVKPADPTKTGYTFGGWYSDEECTQAWNFAIDTVKDNMTLYPKWIRNYVPITTIDGKVFTGEQGDTAVSDATVELYLGTEKVAATVTGGDGSYVFDKVEKGTYNIVVTKTDGKTKTEMVTINDSSATVNVVLPVSEISSKVEHKGNEVSGAKSEISKTVVGDLDAVADANAEEGRKVTVKLTVEPKADTNTPAQTSIKNLPEASGKKVEFLDLSLIKETQGEDDENIGDDNTQILTIVIPFDFSGVNVSSVTILRQHGTDNAEPLKKNPAAGQEGFTVNAAEGTITIYAMKFSDYAVAYSNASHGGGSYTPGHTVTSDLKSVTKVTIDGKVVDSRYYTVSSGTVYLTGEFMKTLANGKHTVKLYDGLKVATGTITVTGNTNVASAATGDVGVALYAALSVSSILGMGWVGRKKRDDK